MTNNQISDSTLNLLAFGPASSVALPCGGILQAAKSLHEDVSVISGSLWPVSSVIIHLLHRKSRRFVAVDGHEEGDIESSDILSIIVPTDALSTGRELFVSQWFQRVSIEDNMTVTWTNPTSYNEWHVQFGDLKSLYSVVSEIDKVFDSEMITNCNQA